MSWILSISFLITLFYFILILSFYSGWKKLKIIPPLAAQPLINISIIIPFRNESENIQKNFKALIKQNYPVSHFEVIYVNDHSEDNTCDILLQLMKNSLNIKLLHLSSPLSGKKAALMEGAKMAKGELFLFTDADCYPVKNWIRTMAGFYQAYKPVMISGPVLIMENKSFFSKFQALEFLSLVGSGAGSFGIKNPILCNAANMGFRRDIYLQYMNEMKKEIFSGDDIFMLLSLKKIYASEMFFLKSIDGLVYTDPLSTLKDFFSQRIRWASKSKFYNDWLIILTAISVFGINFLILLLILLFAAGRNLLLTIIFVIFSKTIIDYIFLRSLNKFFYKKDFSLVFILSEVLYLPYSLMIAIAGSFIIPCWKGRKLNNVRINNN